MPYSWPAMMKTKAQMKTKEKSKTKIETKINTKTIARTNHAAGKWGLCLGLVSVAVVGAGGLG